MVHGGSTTRGEEAVVPAAPPKLRQAAAFEGRLAGIAAASAAISLAVCEMPPAGIHRRNIIYSLALSVSVLHWGGTARRRRQGAERTPRTDAMSSPRPPHQRTPCRHRVLLAAAVGLSVASLIW